MLGNLFNRQTIDPAIAGMRATAAERQRETRQFGSDAYEWVVAATAPAATTSITLATHAPASAKYLPLDWLDVINDDVVGVSILVGGKVVRRIAAGTTRSFRSPGIWQLGIRNDDAAITTTLGKVVITAQKLPFDADEAARERV